MKPLTSLLCRLAAAGALASVVVPLSLSSNAGAAARRVQATANGGAPALVSCQFTVGMVANPGFGLQSSAGQLSSTAPDQATCQVSTSNGTETVTGVIGLSGTYGAGLTSLFGGATCLLDTGNGAIGMTLFVNGQWVNYTGTFQRLGLLLGEVLIGSLNSQAFTAFDNVTSTSGNCVTGLETTYSDNGTMVFEPVGAASLLP